jgi:hypothetical protein
MKFKDILAEYQTQVDMLQDLINGLKIIHPINSSCKLSDWEDSISKDQRYAVHLLFTEYLAARKRIEYFENRWYILDSHSPANYEEA